MKPCDFTLIYKFEVWKIESVLLLYISQKPSHLTLGLNLSRFGAMNILLHGNYRVAFSDQ
jgi:hypothetical protein